MMANDWLGMAGKTVSAYCECNQVSQRDDFWKGTELLLDAGINRIFLGVLANDNGHDTVWMTLDKFGEAIDPVVVLKVNHSNEPKCILVNGTGQEAADRVNSWHASCPKNYAASLDMEQAYREIWDKAWNWRWSELLEFACGLTPPAYLYPGFTSKPDDRERRMLFTAAMMACRPGCVIDNVSHNAPGKDEDEDLEADFLLLKHQIAQRVAIMTYHFGNYYPPTKGGVIAACKSAFEVTDECILNPTLAGWVGFAEALK